MLQPGEVLADRYLLQRKLASGGFGVTFIAHDQKLHDKAVVVKMPIVPSEDDPDFQEWQNNQGWYGKKFRGEILALSRIDHPGVVGVLDSGMTLEGHPFFVMQFIEGRTLRSLIVPEGLPLERIADLMRQVSNAVGAAHDKGVWHRDLKPENIMVEALPEGERVRVIDFGLASLTELRSKSGRESTRISGSLAYMAPEQLTGQPSAASDLYALGVIAYELITGRKPFNVANQVQLYAQQMQDVRVKPKVLQPELTDEGQELILKALSFDPAQRPNGVREFGSKLARELEGSFALLELERLQQEAAAKAELQRQRRKVDAQAEQNRLEMEATSNAEQDRLKPATESKEAQESQQKQKLAAGVEQERRFNRHYADAAMPEGKQGYPVSPVDVKKQLLPEDAEERLENAIALPLRLPRGEENTDDQREPETPDIEAPSELTLFDACVITCMILVAIGIICVIVTSLSHNL